MLFNDLVIHAFFIYILCDYASREVDLVGDNRQTPIFLDTCLTQQSSPTSTPAQTALVRQTVAPIPVLRSLTKQLAKRRL